MKHTCKDSIDDAHSHLSSLSQFSFIVGLQDTQAVFSYTKGLSVKLQGRYTDITRAHHEIEMVKSAVKDARANIDSFHREIYHQAKLIASSVGI